MKEGLKIQEAKAWTSCPTRPVCLCFMGQNLVTKPHPAAREAGTQSTLLKTRSSSLWKKRKLIVAISVKAVSICPLAHKMSGHGSNLTSSSQPKLLSQQKAALQLHVDLRNKNKFKSDSGKVLESCKLHYV